MGQEGKTGRDIWREIGSTSLERKMNDCENKEKGEEKFG